LVEAFEVVAVELFAEEGQVSEIPLFVDGGIEVQMGEIAPSLPVA
jgi:hypothetical protein